MKEKKIEKQISFEDSVDSQNARIRKIHQEEQDTPAISDEDEYRILMGEGIVFKAGKLDLIIPPFKIKEIKILNSMTDLMIDPNVDEIKRLDGIIDILSKVLKVDKETLEENLYKEDLDTILGLCTFSILKGKDMFKKKRITVQEMEAINNYMETLDKI